MAETDFKRSLFNIGLNGKGFLLTNIARKRPRIMNQSSVFGTRFAQGDRSYLDFNLWWYWAQSEWSNGFKDKTSWADDGKYYFSSNIDTFSKVGSLQLMKNVVLRKDFNGIAYHSLICGLSLSNPFTFSGQNYSFIGTDILGVVQSRVYYLIEGGSTWNTLYLGTTTSLFISQILSKNNTLWILQTNDSGHPDYNIQTFNSAGTNIDHSGYITTLLSDNPDIASCGVVYGKYMLIAMNKQSNNRNVIVKTSLDTPFSGESASDWSVVSNFFSQGIISDIITYNNSAYYLLNYGNSVELHIITDPVTSPVDSLVWTFTGCNMTSIYFNPTGERYVSYAGRAMFVQGGKLVITIPDNEIWSWDGTNMNRIFLRDLYKISLGFESDIFLHRGGVKKGDNIFWGNLMYDGTNFFNTIKDLADESTHFYYPLFSDRNNLMWGVERGSTNEPVTNTPIQNLYQETTTYKGASGKNFLVFSQNDVISTIDKIFHHATFNFNYLATGESIIIEYLLSDLTPTSNASWTSLGSASFSVDGAAINTKTIYFPDNTVGKKMWLRAKLEGSGSTTPTFNDIAIAYLPMPDLKHDWTLYLECYDNMILLDGKTKETKRGEELKSLLKFNWWSKTAMDFQDVDYAETTLSSTLVATATAWATGQSYTALTDIRSYNGIIYQCAISHTSGTFATDLAALKWIILPINVASTLDFPEQGRLRIEQEEILYTGKNATQFLNCTRGARGSLAVEHSSATLVATNYKVIIQSLEEFTPELQNIKVKNEESVVVLSLREL